MTTLAGLGRQTFSSLANPNYRRYFAGQAVSLVGTWMQSVGQSWLVLQLTGSGTALGGVIAAQTLPILLLGPYGGVVADRVDKRKLLIRLQVVMGTLALILGVLTLTGQVRLWHVYVLAVLLGLTSCFELPARQAFVLEMVGPGDLRNAISLTSVLINAARAIGPAVAGLVIAVTGIGICFLVNACSYVATMSTLDRSALHPAERAPRARRQVREGLAYVWRTPALAVPLGMMALVGCLAYEFQVVLPVVARDSFGGRPEIYGFMSAAMGVGSVAGGLYVAARGRTGTRGLVVSTGLFAVVLLFATVAPGLWWEYLALLGAGAASSAFLSTGNSTLQLSSDPKMRGRVMALWTVAFLGSTPVGGPIAGWVSEQWGGRAGLLLGAVACVVATAFGALALRRGAVTAAPPAPAPPAPPAPPATPQDAVVPLDPSTTPAAERALDDV